MKSGKESTELEVFTSYIFTTGCSSTVNGSKPVDVNDLRSVRLNQRLT